jgi:hypothetical protein
MAGDRDTHQLPDPNTSDIPQCMVLSCSGAAEQEWHEAPTPVNGITTWPVCREHYLKLTAGAQCEAIHGGPRSFRRWLLMGADLDISPRPLPGQRPRLAP